MEFDIKKYLELNKEFTDLIRMGQSSIASWDERKFSEYRKLSLILYDNVQWQTRYEYYELINNFVENKETIDRLFYDLGSFARKNAKRIDQLRNNLNSETISFFTNESYGFAGLITKLEDITKLFDSEISDSESSNYGISENVLKEYLKKEVLSELQKYCKK